MPVFCFLSMYVYLPFLMSKLYNCCSPTLLPSGSFPLQCIFFPLAFVRAEVLMHPLTEFFSLSLLLVFLTLFIYCICITVYYHHGMQCHIRGCHRFRGLSIFWLTKGFPFTPSRWLDSLKIRAQLATKKKNSIWEIWICGNQCHTWSHIPRSHHCQRLHANP
jgi:hypothetical protein